MNIRFTFTMLALCLLVSAGTAQTKQLDSKEAISTKQDKMGFGPII